MYVSITHIELTSPAKFFQLAASVRKMVRMAEKHHACLEVKTHGFWTHHYTLSLWESKDEMDTFFSKNDLGSAFKSRHHWVRQVRNYAYQDDVLPTLVEAKVLLPEISTDITWTQAS